MSAKEHDEWVALSSHLPYLMAQLMVSATLGYPIDAHIQHLFGSGFKDTTRVASSSVEWGTDVCLHNQEPLLKGLKNVQSHLENLITILENKDRHSLHQFLLKNHDQRENII